MSLKCSLLGHRFDQTAVERDRQEDGSEVVITITELETCTRCGETRVVSENKEVTTLETPADADPADATDADAGTGADTRVSGGPDREGGPDAPDADTGSPGGADAAGGDGSGDVAEVADEAGVEDPTDPAADDGEILGAGGSESDAQAGARSDPTTVPDAGSGESGDGAVSEADAAAEADSAADDDGVADVDAGAGAATGAGEDGEVTDDAVIIDGDTGTERDPGEWPDDGEDGAGEEGDRPESGTGADAVDASGAAWPEETDEGNDPDAMGEWPEETRPDADGEPVDPSPEESASPTVTVPEGMYKCPECGFTAEVESSSLRAGDFCPECHQGALVADGDRSD